MFHTFSFQRLAANFLLATMMMSLAAFSPYLSVSSALAYVPVDIYVSPSGTGSGISMADPTNIYDALSSSGEGDTIHFSSGTYTLTKTLIINKPVNLIGKGGNSVGFDCQFVSICVEYEASSSFSFADIEFSQIDLMYYDVGISLTGSATPTIREVSFDYPMPGAGYAYGIYSTDTTVDEFLLEDLAFRDSSSPVLCNYNWGIYLEDSSPIIQDSSFSNQCYSIWVDEDSANPLIQRNSFFLDNSAGIIIDEFAAAKIEGNIFKGSGRNSLGGVGIGISEAHNVTISGNAFTDSQFGITMDAHYGNDIGDVSIEGNRFENTVYGIASSSGQSVSSDIFANTISESIYGIYLVGEGETSTIDSNYLFSNRVGVYAGLSAESLIINNEIKESWKTSVLFEGAQVTFAYNTVVNGLGSGLKFSDYKTTESGEVLYCDSSTVVNNVVYGHALEGILLHDCSEDVSLGANDSYGNLTNYSGVYVDLGGNIAEDPLFTSGTDFTPSAGSPLIDAADFVDSDWDINGNLRDPMGSTPGAEIGAYEV